MVDYGNVVYIGLSSTNASELQAVLIAAAHLIGGHYKVLFFHQKLPSLASYSPAHTIQDLLSPEKLSYWLCSAITQGLLYPSIFYT